nr:hypothetical protein QKQZYOMX_QKQZYOMX_CDS_0009 [Microvirus sp.]
MIGLWRGCEALRSKAWRKSCLFYTPPSRIAGGLGGLPHKSCHLVAVDTQR